MTLPRVVFLWRDPDEECPAWRFVRVESGLVFEEQIGTDAMGAEAWARPDSRGPGPHVAYQLMTALEEARQKHAAALLEATAAAERVALPRLSASAAVGLAELRDAVRSGAPVRGDDYAVADALAWIDSLQGGGQ